MTEGMEVVNEEEVNALDEMQVLFEALEEAESENTLKDLSQVGRNDECQSMSLFLNEYWGAWRICFVSF